MKHPNRENPIYYNQAYKDWNGVAVERNPTDYPYSYEPYVVEKKADKYKDCVYSDRLILWNYKLFEQLTMKHFDNVSQYWDGRSFHAIENFLRDYFDNKKLELVGIMKGANASNGYPYWIFMFNNNK